MSSSPTFTASQPPRVQSEAHAMLARLRHSTHEASGSGAQEAQTPAPLPWGGKTVAPDETTSKLLLKVDEAAHLLSLSRKMVYDLIGRGELVSLKIGGCRSIPLAALHDFIAWLEAAA
jgi:excisionase family DNA binding protein